MAQLSEPRCSVLAVPVVAAAQLSQLVFWQEQLSWADPIRDCFVDPIV